MSGSTVAVSDMSIRGGGKSLRCNIPLRVECDLLLLLLFSSRALF